MRKRLLNTIDSLATGKKVLLFFALAVIFATCIITMFFGHITLDPTATMDSSDYYTSAVFYGNLDTLGQEGRRAYLMLHVFDYLFMASLAGFLTFSMHLLIKSMTQTPRVYYLTLVPMVYLVFDFLENICIDLSILLYPSRFVPLGVLAGFMTTLKMMVLNMCFVLVSMLALMAFVALFVRMTKDKS